MAKKKRRRGGWRSKFHPEEVIQRVRPTESFEYLDNPHRGTTTFQRFNGDKLYPGLRWSDRWGPEEFKSFKGDPSKLRNPRYPRTTLSYCRWTWDRIEPRKGKFRWKLIDGALRSARECGQTLQARLQPVAGESPWPAWFAEAAGVDPMSHRRNFNWNSPAYVKHWSELIRAFARRYDGHPVLESFDVAYAGGCGETGGNSTPKTARKLADAYLRGFKKTQLISMLGTDGCKYAAKKLGGRAGWRADCFGDVRRSGMGFVPEGLNWCHMYDAYPMEIHDCGVTETWRTSPVTFETCWTVGHWHKEGWDVDWILDQGYKYHISVFMPKSSYIPGPLKKKIDEFDRRIGYRFVPRHFDMPLEARGGEKIRMQVWIDNVGIAPIYRPYRLAFRFRQGKRSKVMLAKTDIRKWMPGHTWVRERIEFPRGLKKGEAKVDVGIVDERRKAEQSVKFAVKERLPDGWHPLTSMDVL